MTNGFSQGEAVLAMTPTPLQTGHRLKRGFSSPPRATERFDPVEPLLVICRLDRRCAVRRPVGNPPPRHDPMTYHQEPAQTRQRVA